jgi:hypothetical protein
MQTELVIIRGPNVMLEPGNTETHELIDALREINGSLLLASHRAGTYSARVLDLFAHHVASLDQLTAVLDEFAIWSGQHGWGEECALLLDFSDSLRAALDRADAHNQEGDD